MEHTINGVHNNCRNWCCRWMTQLGNEQCNISQVQLCKAQCGFYLFLPVFSNKIKKKTCLANEDPFYFEGFLNISSGTELLVDCSSFSFWFWKLKIRKNNFVEKRGNSCIALDRSPYICRVFHIILVICITIPDDSDRSLGLEIVSYDSLFYQKIDVEA